jgi:hypothetical protein
LLYEVKKLKSALPGALSAMVLKQKTPGAGRELTLDGVDWNYPARIDRKNRK